MVGYAFYHSQDTERAVDGGGIYVRFGAAEDDREQKTQVGQLIVDAARRAGLRAEWNGDPNTCVLIDLNWQRRQPVGELPSE